eukprot:TRINITY_DN6189_c0_g1_i2.p1 TRINITY_DN6189_c0_g1~~TRINITY_DN6189_c0_g1_i2.p1  ORF type:complete len:137 (-),score=3.90 TRINITY_DN6189_c0_g1_i2:160-570(-)
MGSAVCCAEGKCWHSAEDAVDIELKTTVGMRLVRGIPTLPPDEELVPSALIMQLQGHWYRRSSGEVVGEIFDSRLLWDSIHQETATVSPLSQVSDSQIQITMTDSKTKEQQPYVADVSLEAQATLSWPDGDIWIRK